MPHYRGIVVNFFSRPNAATQRRKGAPPQVEPPGTTRASAFSATVAKWRDDLQDIASGGAGDNAPQLTISAAHPGGLAQLYADHPTRLSNLVREPSAQRRALERAHNIIQRTDELTARHGMGVVHLAIGRASWTHNGIRKTSPALLRPVHLDRADSDVLLTLRPGATLAPVLADALHAAGNTIDLPAIVAQATTVHGFSSSKVLAALKKAVHGLENFDIRDELVLGIFEHPATTLLRELDRDSLFDNSELLCALAGDQAARESLGQSLPPANPKDRDPRKELGAGDLTPRQQDVVEAVAAGRSLIIDVPDGADDRVILGALLADAASKGRSTVHVGGSLSHAARAQARLRDLGLEEIAARVDATPEAAVALRERIRSAMADTSPVTDGRPFDEMRDRLTSLRALLSAHTEQLHKPFGAFGVSAFDALQVLTDLTSGYSKPRTRVRLREEVLLDIASDRGERARKLLHHASALGVFARSTAHGAWRGAVINSPDQVGEILTRVTRLANDTLPALRVHMTTVAGETGIRPAVSIADWEEQLAMFEGVRDVLDIFQPRIFERSAADMVFATAPKQWRRDHGITMPRRQRIRLVRNAQDMLRPGVHVKDLHRELLFVQERRDVWRQHCDSDGWPKLPQRIDEAITLTRSVRDDLAWLAPTFSTSQVDLLAMPVKDLGKLLDRLAADPQGAHELPKRVAVLKALKEAGLEGLTKDLRDRNVDDGLIDAELDLAWWASILALMIASDPSLGGFDPTHLEAALAEGRELDRQQVASLAPQVVNRLRRLRRNAMAADPQEQTDLQISLSNVVPAVDMYAGSELLWKLIPVVLTMPTLVPWLMARIGTVDLLILDDVDSISLAELAPVIARARQVVVLADVSTAAAGGTVEQLAAVLPKTQIEAIPRRLNDQVALLLARHGIGHTGVPIPWTSASAPVTAVWCDGTGMPAPGATAVESTSPEVQTVVDLVIEHAVDQPDRSLMVVALNARHASRLRVTLDRAIAAEPAVASFFDPSVAEPFVVVDPSLVRGLSRDRVIVTVGYAKTPHGRVLHDFGELSRATGVSLMASALVSVRGDLTVVSSLRAGEIDPSRITTQGTQMLVDLLEIAEGQSGEGSGAWPTLEAAPDRLLVDLAERLYGLGLEVVPNVGIPGGVRIPLAIGHPEVPGRLLVAVLTDDETYVAQPSLRLRDRLLPAMLEEQGWKVYTALSMPVFIDPAKEADALVQVVLDAVDDVNGPPVPVIEVPVLDVESEEAADEALLPSVAAADVAEADVVAVGELDADVLEQLEPDLSVDVPPRGPRPSVAQGLPLSAYGDDQLDELAMWVRSDGIERSHEELLEELRAALGLTRRGAQSDAVLGNVVRRTQPPVDSLDEARAGEVESGTVNGD